MKAVVRLTRSFAAEIRADLERPHPVAAERIGFLCGRWAFGDEHMIVYPVDYLPVSDENYIEAPLVGATINSVAIRAALQATLDRKAACLHVHLHPSRLPRFSDLDLREQDRLIPSFTATNRDAPHGALVLWGDAGGAARLWPPCGGAPLMADRIAFVGYPTVLSGGGR